ncbi:hypothetical protein DM02DRAFT_372789 [Periconia macrospinosa]|uniref:Uncharacterized protein n=1 Tax=Periconia macrospinosa TaxID=97972 RepID=A0A2V1DRX6_9PLEO|nr:hypothetical protein DM02DRAFT_372789 [Periconia macrospinosa]
MKRGSENFWGLFCSYLGFLERLLFSLSLSLSAHIYILRDRLTAIEHGMIKRKREIFFCCRTCGIQRIIQSYIHFTQSFKSVTGASPMYTISISKRTVR